MKTISLFLIFILTFAHSYAQQNIQISNFDYFSSFYNPAATTSTQHLCGTMIGRNQWSGFSGRPNTGFINVNYNFSNLLWGNLAFAQDHIGLQQNSLLKLGVAKSLALTKSVSISFGLNLNFTQHNWTANYITPDTPVPNDNSIPNNDISATSFDMDAGVFIQAKDITLGFSSTQLTEPTLTQPSFNYQHKRHYYVLAGYEYHHKFGDFENSFLAKSDVASTQMDFKSNFWHNQGWMVGLAYRLSDAVIPMIGYQKTINPLNIRCVYSYDITTSKLNAYSSGTHEICLKICLVPPKHAERYTHPRHLGTWK